MCAGSGWRQRPRSGNFRAAGTAPAQLPADSAFAAGQSGLPQAYEESWLACRYLAQRVGVAGLVRFYREVGRAVLPANYAVAVALRDVLHETLATFTAQWRRYLTEELG